MYDNTVSECVRNVASTLGILPSSQSEVDPNESKYIIIERVGKYTTPDGRTFDVKCRIHSPERRVDSNSYTQLLEELLD